MKKILINIGTRSKEAFAQSINTNKKDKILGDYLKMIRKNKHLILKENKKDEDKLKTIQQLDREKLDKKFTKETKETLN